MKRAAFPGFAFFLLISLASLLNTGCSPAPPSHGTAFLVLVATNQQNLASDSENALARTREVLRKRVEKAGFDSPFFQMTNDGQLTILVSSRLESNIATLRQLIERSGVLEFRMVHPESEELQQSVPAVPGQQEAGDGHDRGEEVADDGAVLEESNRQLRATDQAAGHLFRTECGRRRAFPPNYP